jgi:c-di-GMP-binding flagellar brake protein YcgR
MKERRRDPRVNEENKVTLNLLANGSPQGPKSVYHSLTKDISLGGIRVMTDAPLAVDSRIKVELTLAKSRKRIRAVARVRWVKELFGQDVFDMGLEFVDIDPEAELALIDHIYGKKGFRT